METKQNRKFLSSHVVGAVLVEEAERLVEDVQREARRGSGDVAVAPPLGFAHDALAELVVRAADVHARNHRPRVRNQVGQSSVLPAAVRRQRRLDARRVRQILLLQNLNSSLKKWFYKK
jgi:hypothetical protein